LRGSHPKPFTIPEAKASATFVKSEKKKMKMKLKDETLFYAVQKDFGCSKNKILVSPFLHNFFLSPQPRLTGMENMGNFLSTS
jgi:hypothetical protein